MRTKRKTQTAVEGFAQTEEFAYLLSSLNNNRKPLDQLEFVENKEKLKFYSRLPSFDILHNVFEHVFPFVEYRWSPRFRPHFKNLSWLYKNKINLTHHIKIFHIHIASVSPFLQFKGYFSACMVALDVQLAWTWRFMANNVTVFLILIWNQNNHSSWLFRSIC